MKKRNGIVRRTLLTQPRVPGLQREPVWSTLDPRIKRAVRHHAARLGVSASWFVHTILADACGIDLDEPLRAFERGVPR